MDQRTDAQAIALYARLLGAWNRRSAADFAALFAKDGNTVGFDGSPLDGQAAIASALQEIFTSHPTAAYAAKIREIRPLGPGATLLRAVVGMVPPGHAQVSPAVNALQSVIMVEEGGELRIALLHNTPAAFHGRPQAVDQLTEELNAVLRSEHIVQLG